MYSQDKYTQEPLEALSRIAHSSKEYYQLLSNGPGPEHFIQFLNSLPEGLRVYYQQKGYEASHKSVLFRRYVLEQAGRRMDAFLRARLNEPEFALWQAQDRFQLELLYRLKESA